MDESSYTMSWWKSYVTLLSMDESSYTMSCPDDLCMKKDGWDIMFGESQVVYDKLEEPLNNMLWKWMN